MPVYEAWGPVGPAALPALAEARAGAYGFFSTLFLEEFSPALAGRIAQPEVQPALTEILGHNEDLADLFAETDKARLDPAYMNDLQLEYHRLFLVPGPAYLTPYESCYREKKPDGGMGNNWGQGTREVRAIYVRFGVKSLAEFKELPDHAGIELAFMQFLAEQESAAARANNSSQMTNLKLWQQHFFNQHLLCWLPELAAKLAGTAEYRFYQVVAALVLRFVNKERIYFAASGVEANC